MNARSILPLFFGLTSLTAIACAAPVATQGEQGSAEEPAAEAIDGAEVASRLSGAVGSAVDHARGGELPETDGAMAAPITELVVQPGGPSETVYEVLSYAFGIATDVQVGGSMKGAVADKSSFAPLSVTVRPVKPGASPLMSRLVTGMHLDKLVLRQRTTGTPGTKAAATTEIAEFETAIVGAMTTGIQNGTMDSFEIAFGKLTLKLPGSKEGVVSHDVMTNQSTGEALCGPHSAAALGPYVQADPSWKLPMGAVRIDSASVAISNSGSMSPTGTAGAGTARLEQIAIDMPMEKTGVCALYYSTLGARVPTVRIDAASSVDKGGSIVLDQRWEACDAYATQVFFSGGAGQTPRQTIVLTAEGVVRTDYASGKSMGTFGWSFAENKAIASCSK